MHYPLILIWRLAGRGHVLLGLQLVEV